MLSINSSCVLAFPVRQVMTQVMQGTGDDGDDVEASSRSVIQTEGGFHPVFFQPRKLKYLLMVDELKSLMPITEAKARHFSVALYVN